MLKILLLVGLIKALSSINRPFLCAGIYGSVILIFGLFFGALSGASAGDFFIGWVIETTLVSLYFWLLYKLDGTGLWWVVMFLGIGGIVYLGMASWFSVLKPS